MNVLLDSNIVVIEKQLAFQQKQKEYYNKAKNNIINNKTEDEIEILKKTRNERAKIFYNNNKEKCKSYRIPILSKINLYVSALNTCKIKKINQKKLDEYHITFNQDTNKYEVNTEYAISFYKISYKNNII